MSQIKYRANLASDDIPLLSAFHGQTVIVGRFDQDFELVNNLNNPQRLQKEKQGPQAYYCHNVMPTGKGYQSVGYLEKITPLLGAIDFRGIYTLRDPLENKSFYSPSGGKNYIYDRNVGSWVSVGPISGRENTLVTIAYLNGETYIYYAKVGCFKYNKTTKLLETVVLVDLIPEEINGICSAKGILVCWDDTNTIFRSQAASPLVFTPDAALGSGAGVPEEIKGKIVVLLPITNGFIVYTTANAVAGIFQQNIRYPFIYNEITGSNGIQSPDQVSWTDNLGEHFVYSKAGILRLNKSTATTFYPEITDFLISKVFENFDEVTNTFVVTRLTSQVKVKLTLVGSRFLIISYGIETIQFTHAIIYDLAFKRFGKLKINHVDCFNYSVPNLSGEITWEMLGELSWEDLGDTTWTDFAENGVKTIETPKEILGFLGMDGKINIVNFDLVHSDDSGVLILGKYQFSRDRLIVLDEIDFENVDENANFDLKLLGSIDGKNISEIKSLYLNNPTGQIRTFSGIDRTEYINFALAAKGTFNLNSLKLTFHTGGRR